MGLLLTIIVAIVFIAIIRSLGKGGAASPPFEYTKVLRHGGAGEDDAFRAALLGFFHEIFERGFAHGRNVQYEREAEHWKQHSRSWKTRFFIHFVVTVGIATVTYLYASSRLVGLRSAIWPTTILAGIYFVVTMLYGMPKFVPVSRPNAAFSDGEQARLNEKAGVALETSGYGSHLFDLYRENLSIGQARGETLGYDRGKADGRLMAETKSRESYAAGLAEGKRQGLEEGLEQGKLLAHDEGYQRGLVEGHANGRNEGYTKGYSEGHGAGYREGRAAGGQGGDTAASFKAGYDKGKLEGVKEGKDLGRRLGFSDGLKEGRRQAQKESYEAGYQEGYEEGVQDGSSRASRRGKLTLEEAYDVLSCAPASPIDVIKSSYRSLCKSYHPDVVTRANLAEGFMRFAHEEQQKINAAYAKIKAARQF